MAKAKKSKKTNLRSDVTDQSERWCLVKCAPGQRFAEPLKAQCEHAQSPGQYVVQSGGIWHIFDPPTRMQALSWVNGRQERQNRIHWLCHTCGQIMPLGSYAMRLHPEGGTA